MYDIFSAFNVNTFLPITVHLRIVSCIKFLFHMLINFVRCEPISPPDIQYSCNHYMLTTPADQMSGQFSFSFGPGRTDELAARTRHAV